MAFLRKTGEGLDPLRRFFLMVAIFALAWTSANSLVDALASCHDASDDCGSSTTDKEFVSHWTTQPSETTTSSPDEDYSENSSTTPSSDSITFQPDDAASEPPLSNDDSSDTRPSSDWTTSNSEELLTFTMDSEESVTLMTEESETTPPGKLSNLRLQPDEADGTISMRTSRFRYERLTCCHLARNFPFADKLRDDPCNVMKSEGMDKKEAADYKTDIKQVYDNLVDSVEKLKRLAESTLKNDVPIICKDVRWYPVAKIPTRQDLKSLSTKDILNLYHSSLLNHTAYLHHMYYQVHKYDRSCNRGEIVLSARRLTIDVKKVTCFLRRYILAVFDEYNDESFKKPFDEILDVSLCEECVCISRSLYDCHVILSLNSVLTQLANFMREFDPVVVLQPVGPASKLSTDKPSDTTSNGWTTSDSKESATLSTDESTTTPPGESSDSQPAETATESTLTSDEKLKLERSPCQPVTNFEFADKLRDDPCKVWSSGGVSKKAVSNMKPFQLKEVHDFVSGYLELLKRTSDDTLRNDVLNDCKLFKLGPVAHIPTQRDLQVHSPDEILFMYYSSLLNHTAHLNNMYRLLLKYNGYTCSKGVILASSHKLALDIRPLTCTLRLYIMAVYDEYDDDSFRMPSMEVMNESLCDAGQCSRRAIYDCQVVSSLDTLVNELAAFMEKIDPIEAKQKLEPSIQIRFKRMLDYPEW